MSNNYKSMNDLLDPKLKRRDFLKLSGATGLVLGGIALGTPNLWAQDQKKQAPPTTPKTNIDEILKIPRTKTSMPGPFPGVVTQIHNDKAIVNDKIDAAVVKSMVEKSITSLTGKNLKESFNMLFTKNDIIGLKVNPVGAGLISTRLEVVDAVIDWLKNNGVPSKNIIIWDRFDYMLKDAGFTAERYPGIGIEGLQTMDESAMAGPGQTKDNSKWLDKNGKHLSEANFDKNVYYLTEVETPTDLNYLNQNVFNTNYSYFGNLVTQKLTKIINLPVFKNTGNGISMATKNIGYGAICNTARLHRPLFFNVCAEIPAFPAIRDKLVLNITDGLRAQYHGGPMPNAKFTYIYNTIFAATDMIALDMTCHNLMVQKRKEMNAENFNEHPRFSDYLHYAQKMNLGIADTSKIKVVKA